MSFRPTMIAAAVSLTCGFIPNVFSADNVMIEEVIVTAQKRSQSVQDIPLAVTAMSAEMLDERGITGVASLVSSVPGMHFGQAGANTRITIRGIGS